MRRLLVIALLAVAALGLSAAPAQADERTCYSPSVGGFDTFEMCYYLPVELTD